MQVNASQASCAVRLTAICTDVGTTKSDATRRGKIDSLRCIISPLLAEFRPCAGCHKKGLTAEQCVYGCEACRRAQARCEGGAPCLRCVSMHLNCVHGATLPLTTLQPRGKSGKRAKLACKNCRRDNKKVSGQRADANEGRALSLTDALRSQCEDQRPCRRCVLRRDECIHVARRPKLVKVRCQPCRETNRRCEDARPCQSCSTHGEMCINPPKKGRVNGTRVKVVSMSYVFASRNN